MNIDWKVVQGYKELPLGQWIVILDNRDSKNTGSWQDIDIFHYEIAHVSKDGQGNKFSIIGGLFGYDQKRVLAYRSIPKFTRKNLNENHI